MGISNFTKRFKGFKLTEDAPDPAADKAQLAAEIREQHVYLRGALDRAAARYQDPLNRSEGLAMLSDCVEGEALNQVISALDAYNARGVVVVSERSDATLEIEEVTGSPPTSFKVVETFRDTSRLEARTPDGRVVTRPADRPEARIRWLIRVVDAPQGRNPCHFVGFERVS